MNRRELRAYVEASVRAGKIASGVCGIRNCNQLLGIDRNGYRSSSRCKRHLEQARWSRRIHIALRDALPARTRI